jgi:hypothetical protein
MFGIVGTVAVDRRGRAHASRNRLREALAARMFCAWRAALIMSARCCWVLDAVNWFMIALLCDVHRVGAGETLAERA